MALTWAEFVENWSQSHLREQQAAQSHFNELCELAGHKTPSQLDPNGTFFTFEENVEKATGGKGRADVWYNGHFAWEYKGKHKDLDAAYAQLLAYRGGLGNPPLLVVCDFVEFRIYPQWPNTSGQPFIFRNEDLVNKEAQRYINWLLFSPDQFLELRQSELEARQQLTLELANKFAHLADLMRAHTDEAGNPVWQPIQIARFLTKLVFCLFAEDIDLMPRPFDQPVFRYLTEGARTSPDPQGFVKEVERLFGAMDGRESAFILKAVPYFNGGIFAGADGLEVLDLTVIPGGIDLLEEVSQSDWRKVDPSIFGTLFEGALDAGKRAQLGAHFTSEQDIRLVVEPVLMDPLNRQWDEIRAEAEPLLQTWLKADVPRAKQEAENRLKALHDRMMDALEQTKILDPACGSGNFLYVSLRAMKDLEAKVRKFFEPLGLPFRDVITPRQLYGIEKDEFAAKLAHVVCWIGYLQWRYEDEGVLHFYHRLARPHPRQLPNPIIQDKYTPDEPDHIQCADAIMRYDESGQPYEPQWPAVDVIMGNPPFLGDKFMRSGRPELGQTGLGDKYVENLRRLYEGRIPGQSDLVCYWFEKARQNITEGKVKRAGLLSTNSIRQGANRSVLDRIKETGDIFIGWSDKEWVLSGAAVRISIVGFDDGTQKEKYLDGQTIAIINSDLSSSVDVTQALVLSENEGICFLGMMKAGPFDIDAQLAQKMLNMANTSGKSNNDVVKPRLGGQDVTGRARDGWVIDFGVEMSEEEAMLYEAPYQYVLENVKPLRDENRRKKMKEKWWIHGEARPGLRRALSGLNWCIVTPEVAKHRVFIWMDTKIIPDHKLHVFSRDDDYFFGILHSFIHEIWTLATCSWMGVGNDPSYSSSRTFETFPFPWPPGQEDTNSAHHAAISAAAKQLHEEREAWLNPPELTGPNAGIGAADSLKKRTLTNLYNALVDYRTPHPPAPSPTQAGRGGENNGGQLAGLINGPRKAQTPADVFAPRLHALHLALDQAVLGAYGWADMTERLYTAEGEEDILRRLLALNLERAGQ